MDKKLKKIDNYVYQIDKTGEMNVPVKVFASEKLLEKMKQDNCLEQGINVACMPGICKQSIMMPDSHQGYGFSVGGVAAFDVDHGCISPGGIGYDINCGVRLLASNLTKDQVEKKIKELVNTLFELIPSGVGSESKIRLSDEEYNDVLNKGLKWALEKGYARKEDLDRCEENGQMKTADASKVTPRAKARGRKQLGTLGAGNHFLEVQVVEKIFDKEISEAFGLKENQIVVMIHSGSRGLGHQTCTDYLKKIEEEFPELIKKLPDRELAYAPTTSNLSKDYLKAMSAAANYAWCNRQVITFNVRNAFKQVFGKEADLDLVYDVAHNIAKVEEYEINKKKVKTYVHRKGATRAFGPGNKEIPKMYQKVGQPILIPGSMGTASWVLAGTEKARDETFSSTPHGAGRMMSRHEANKRFTSEGINKELNLNKIYIKAASKRGITEEAPGAYKDVDEVVKVADEVGIGKLVARLRPIGVMKG